jgi:exopolyphosphatase/guanosine-5'-triphosphate,3'-diphosphate pyrophosphatase
LPGIGPRRAEIIIAGAAVFAELMTRLNLRGFRYSPLGLRDGLLAQMAADYGHSQPMQTRIATERSDAILAMSRHYRIDVKHADRVRAAAEKLFVKLAAVHRLPSTYRHLIAAAAMLHEVGAFINRSGRYRHAYYVIANSDIFGFTPAERQIIAALARYAGKTKPEDSHAIVRAIRPSERSAFRVAVALLRLARSMDESRRGNIVDFTVRRRQAAVTLQLTIRGSAELELWSLNKQRVFFRTVCGADLVATERSNRGTKTSAGR